MPEAAPQLRSPEELLETMRTLAQQLLTELAPHNEEITLLVEILKTRRSDARDEMIRTLLNNEIETIPELPKSVATVNDIATCQNPETLERHTAALWKYIAFFRDIKQPSKPLHHSEKNVETAISLDAYPDDSTARQLLTQFRDEVFKSVKRLGHVLPKRQERRRTNTVIIAPLKSGYENVQMDAMGGRLELLAHHYGNNGALAQIGLRLGVKFADPPADPPKKKTSNGSL